MMVSADDGVADDEVIVGRSHAGHKV